MRPLPQLTPAQAAELIPNGATLMVGGFGQTGTPVHLLHALAEQPVTGLTIIANNIGEPGLGGGRLLRHGQIRHAIGSFFTSNPEAVAAAQARQITVELLPQGSLAEAIRAGGAGLGGFYTPTAVGTPLAKGREVRHLNGRDYLFIPALRADVALIRAWRADTAGNLVYRLTERNFNPLMATAAERVIAEVEEIVPVGTLDPDHIVTPGHLVDYLVQAKLTTAELGSSAAVGTATAKADEARWRIARRALAELRPGQLVNLGVGIPTLIADLITPAHGLTLHTENGMIGVGPAPTSGGALDYPVNAGKQPVTPLPGASYFDSALSFALIRGGHVDVAVMGGLQVDEQGSLANWAAPGKPLLGVGGAMDLATGAKTLIITMTHTDSHDRPKIVPRVTFPLTAQGVVDVIITELAVFRFIHGRLTLTERMPNVTLAEIQAHTSAEFRVLSSEG